MKTRSLPIVQPARIGWSTSRTDAEPRGKREPNNCSRWLCTSRDCPHFEKMKASATPLELVWHGNSDPCWDFKTAIPHETFEVYDEGILYCRGVVFALADVPTC